MRTANHILSKGQRIDAKYEVAFFLKKGSYAETYRVKDEGGTTKFLKLFDYSKLHRTQFDENDDVLEVEVLKRAKHPNLVHYFDDGIFLHDKRKYAYVILDFISGETLADKLTREENLTEDSRQALERAGVGIDEIKGAIHAVTFRAKKPTL